MRLLQTTVSLALCAGLSACSAADTSESGGTNTEAEADSGGRGRPDTGVTTDAGMADAGASDDAGAADSDTGTETDAGTSDTSGNDTGRVDTGSTTDAGTGNDAGATDTGATDTGATDSDFDASDSDICAAETAGAENVTRPVDIIWVVDGSPSMDDSITIIEANINEFASRIGASGLDYRVVLIGADEEYCFDGRCYSEICVPPPLSASPGCPDTDSPVFRHVRQGVHSSDAIDLAIDLYDEYSDFLREGANTHIVFVTDDDAGFGPGREEFAAFVDSNIAPGSFQVQIHSVVDLVDSPPGCGVFDEDCSCGDERGDEYIALSEETGGLVQSVCEEDWSPIFEALEERVVEGTALPCEFAIPEVEYTVEVDRVNVVFVSPDGTRSTVPNVDDAAACAGGTGWYYDNIDDPTAVILCDAACEGISGSLELEFGCRTIKG